MAFLGPVAKVKVETLLEQIDLLDRQVHEVEWSITELMEKHNQYLTTIKGIGPVFHSIRQYRSDLDDHFQWKLAKGKSYKIAVGTFCRKVLARVYVVRREN